MATVDVPIMSTTPSLPAKTSAVDEPAPTKNFRRSRSGCFTCRLRRKKCEEGKPHCKACGKLGLQCHYQRPVWWLNPEQRKQHKDLLKEVIKQSTQDKKTAAGAQYLHPIKTMQYPAHSLPSGITEGYSAVSPLSYADASPLVGSAYDYSHMQPAYFAANTSSASPASAYPWSPDVVIRRDSSASNHFQPLPTFESTDLHQFTPTITTEYFDSPVSSLPETSPTATPSDPPPPIYVDEVDRPLLNHFMSNVARLMFPVLNVHQNGLAVSNMIAPALAVNKSYLHCCLTISALHLRATGFGPHEQISHDLIRHQSWTTSLMRQALNQDAHADVLETTLAMVLFRSRVDRVDVSGLTDIPWHQHLQAATSLAYKVQLPEQMSARAYNVEAGSQIDMVLMAWTDIIGATMRGTHAAFAGSYAEFRTNNCNIGLSNLMGCDDRVMFLIGEIATLEARKLAGLNDVALCHFIETLGAELGKGETQVADIRSAVFENGIVNPQQLDVNITALYRLAARIYLCTLVPGCPSNSANITNLVAKTSAILTHLPAGPDGFDTSLVWPLLICGSVSAMGSQFRAVFSERCFRLGPWADQGSFGLMRRVLGEVWAANDAPHGGWVHWREVMRRNGWDGLLI